ncbi:MAG TPA: hypothetical protein VMV77_08980 [Bacteroidales bacterium]|nr:hypothetical protein [Bacteroidales bacterium]
MTKENFYTYRIQGGYVKGLFNIYQTKEGSIRLAMNNNTILLTPLQIDLLNINVYELIDFNIDAYKLFYSL